MSESEERDVWATFDEVVETAQADLEAANENYDAIGELGGRLSPVYATALDELSENVAEFDSVYQVDEERLYEAQVVADRAELLADITSVFQVHQERFIEHRVALLSEWFDTLKSATTETNELTETDLPELEKRITAANKLSEAGKFTQIYGSERVDLDRIEEGIQTGHKEAKRVLESTSFVAYAIDLIDRFKNRYTDDLSSLVNEGANRSAISVRDTVDDTPDINGVRSRIVDGDNVDDRDVEQVSEVLDVYYEVALTTGQRTADLGLCQSLVDIVTEAGIADPELEDQLRMLLERLEADDIRDEVASLLAVEVTPSDREQVLRLLRQHDGSVRRTLAATDHDPMDLFETIHELLVDDEVSDLEVRYE